MDSGKVITDIELLKIARERTASYVDMGHFRDPREATPYLIDGFQRGYRHAEKELKLERDELKGKLGVAVEMVKKLVDAQLYSAKETERIKNELFPNVESCGCESPCDCTYPLGYIDLDQHKYHCWGSEIMASEALKEISK